jgi:carbamoylphosphate synthase large subunit
VELREVSEAEDVLGTQMKSVGEVMAIGRTFKEVSLQRVAFAGSGEASATRRCAE